MDEPMERLGEYLQSLENHAKVSVTDPRNRMLRQGCEQIVQTLLHDISKQDPRLSFKFYGSGSYYDGVKVGEPDEFDFIAEIKELSAAEAVNMVKTSDPGFVQIEVPSMEVKQTWRDCLILPEHLQSASAKDMYHPLPGEHPEDTMEVSERDIYQSTCMLAPFKVQKLFRKYVDDCMHSIHLPENWVHSGYKKPNYSGCRRHGPACMLQFAHIVPEEEIKINIDITIGIAVPMPTNAKKLNLYIFDHVRGNRIMHEKLEEIFTKGPQMHVIPLYSNVLIKTHRYQNKFAWRISCSLVETAILDSFPDDGPKLCLRILKAVRDAFLCDGKRKTRRKKRRRKRQKRSDKTGRKPDGSVSSCNSVSGMPASEYTTRMKQTRMAWVNIKQQYMKLNKEHCSERPEETVGPTTPIVHPSKETSPSNQGDKAYDDLTDATELEDKSKEEAFQEFRKTRILFQRKDISDMVAEPGSGEYYGPKTYMSSIEIKTYVLRLIAGHAEAEYWSLNNITRHVNDFLRSYHTILLERKMMKNFFFDSMVCAPISEEQRLKALEKFNVLFEELNKVMEGKVAAGSFHLVYYVKANNMMPFCFRQDDMYW